ncbi:protein kinase C substrate [Aspergillus avenaceus]|uniref:Glucosidase 2 subunit beta n=1 Tax=Aspergillus avenaceus TaxID=36643 RepID=A0A5N6U1M6_ASPAV|nr:protein kinase C substrate [Aspergillus avenaceus]
MILPSVLLVGLAASAVAKERPRGVGPEFAKFYKDEPFTCISHPSIQLPPSSVNDDYCDCPDGSDEPGTAACAHLSPNTALSAGDRPGSEDWEVTLALPGFYCKNKGHRPAYVPFQRVNDGICDYGLCCDGSDEWARVGGVQCEDRCKEIGKEWRRDEEKRAKSMNVALKRKGEMLDAAGRQRVEIEENIRRLGDEIRGLEVKVVGMEGELEELEKRERGKVVAGKKGGKVNVLAGVARGRVEELRGALLEVRKGRDEARSRVRELEEILATFKVEYNPNFNDEGVKRAVRSWEEYAARGVSVDNEARDRDLDEIAKPDDDSSGVNWELWENESDACDADAVAQLAAYLPPSLVSFIEDKVVAVRSFLEDNGVLAKKDGTASETKAVTEARDALNAARKSVDDMKSQMQGHKDDLETDYGQDSIFRALKGVCIQKDAGEYTYEHCFLDQTRQIPKKGGSTARMGSFVRIGSVTVDELNESGEIVPEERVAIEYAKGQTCWNGPARSTTVVLQCGEENEILKIAEDEKCVYSMLVTTPAVCSGENPPPNKDEL